MCYVPVPPFGCPDTLTQVCWLLLLLLCNTMIIGPGLYCHPSLFYQTSASNVLFLRNIVTRLTLSLHDSMFQHCFSCMFDYIDNEFLSYKEYVILVDNELLLADSELCFSLNSSQDMAFWGGPQKGAL